MGKKTRARAAREISQRKGGGGSETLRFGIKQVNKSQISISIVKG